MTHEEHRQLQRFLKTAIFFCVFCMGYTLIGINLQPSAQLEDSKTLAQIQQEEDAEIYAKMGIIAPAAGGDIRDQ